jgi:BlaI family penicillinase repressor
MEANMGSKYQISDAEWSIMKIIWSHERITANEIIEILSSDKEWAPKTVKSMLSRLLAKEIIGFIKDGRSYKYYPLVSSEETIKDETKTFVEKVFDGSVSNLIANFVEHNKFTEEEIDALKQILEKKKA